MGIKRTVSIRRIDLWGRKPLELKQMKQKMQKTEMSIFPMYFWANSFVKFNVIVLWLCESQKKISLVKSSYFWQYNGIHLPTYLNFEKGAL